MSDRHLDRWPDALVRHLRLVSWHPREVATAIREGDEIVYTLVIHPDQEERADELQARLEHDPRIGGLFNGGGR